MSRFEYYFKAVLGVLIFISLFTYPIYIIYKSAPTFHEMLGGIISMLVGIFILCTMICKQTKEELDIEKELNKLRNIKE